jgi:hypothetical protein
MYGGQVAGAPSVESQVVDAQTPEIVLQRAPVPQYVYPSVHSGVHNPMYFPVVWQTSVSSVQETSAPQVATQIRAELQYSPSGH